MSDITAKASPNYTEQMLKVMKEEYEVQPTRDTVNSLADQFDKTERSIIAKLSALGIYQKQERVTKRGEPVTLKAELIERVQNQVGRELPSLAKMTKPDLNNLINALLGLR